MDIKTKVLNYIKEHNLLVSGDSVICAVSGGADSVCMLDLLFELKAEFSLTLYVAHLNHMLRGEDADRDEKFVEHLAKNYSLPFYCERVDVDKLSEELGVSCEEAGRIARYEFFKKLKETLGCNKIATAHNKNDNVETVLMRFLRGTDMKGLSGIPVHNNLDVIRPIMCLKRSEIEEYNECKGINFVTDSTNLENIYSRNKIRNSLIPEIEEQFNSAFIDTMSSNIELFTEANSYIEKKVNTIYENIISKDRFVFSFCVAWLMCEDKYIAKRIIKKTVYELARLNITNDLCNHIYDSLINKSSLTISKNLNFYVKYERAYFVKKREIADFCHKISSPGTYYFDEIPLTLEITEGCGKISFKDKNTIYLNPDKVSCNFLIRSRKNGDKMTLANCGTKKLKDIFIDEKIPLFLRDRFPVIEYNGEIIWLCGLRDNTEYRAKSGNDYIKITVHKENNNE